MFALRSEVRVRLRLHLSSFEPGVQSCDRCLWCLQRGQRHERDSPLLESGSPRMRQWSLRAVLAYERGPMQRDPADVQSDQPHLLLQLERELPIDGACLQYDVGHVRTLQRRQGIADQRELPFDNGPSVRERSMRTVLDVERDSVHGRDAHLQHVIEDVCAMPPRHPVREPDAGLQSIDEYLRSGMHHRYRLRRPALRRDLPIDGVHARMSGLGRQRVPHGTELLVDEPRTRRVHP